MGSGSYSSVSRSERVAKMEEELGYSYYTAPSSKIFSSKMNEKMSPIGITFRESRDSDEHPNSFPIILGLDVTGSMGSIPDYLIKEGLPKIMSKIIEGGIKDPQLLFVGIGDSHYDNSPLQVGQFESSDELLDYWLENIYLESGGGGNNGEDYLLGYHFALNHTVTDSFEKRKIKGVLITIGDERYLELDEKHLSKVYQTNVQPIKSKDLIKDVNEKWKVFHIHTNNKDTQGGVNIEKEWKELLGAQNVIVENNRERLVDVIVKIVLDSFEGGKNSNKVSDNENIIVDNSPINLEKESTGIKAKKML